MTDAELMARLFWRKGRQSFVELTLEDAMRAVASPPDVAWQKLDALVDKGFAVRSSIKLGNTETQTWYLSGPGRAIVKAQHDAET